MFPGLHIKDAEKGGPEPSPRKNMALFEKLTIPSQSLDFAGSHSFFPLTLGNYSRGQGPSSSCHVSSSHAIQFDTSGAPTYLTEKIHAYHSVFNSNKLTYLFQPGDFLHCEKFSLKKFDGERALETPESSHGRTLFCSINQNNRDEDKLKGKKSYRERHESTVTYTHSDASNMPISTSTLGMDISSDDVLRIMGSKKFWKIRSTIINQRRVFLAQVFELHRLIKVQRLIAGSPHLLLEDNHLLRKPSLAVSACKNLQSDFVTKQPSSIAKLNGKFMKPAVEHAENYKVGNIPVLRVSNKRKGPLMQLPNYCHHSRSLPATPLATNTKQSPCCVYKWLVPIMSPYEGLVYKPFVGPGPSNASFLSHNTGNKDALDAAHTIPASHKWIGILAGTPLPPCDLPIMHPSISASAVEQMNPFAMIQSKGPENCKPYGYTLLHQSSYNISNQMSEVMSNLKHTTNYCLSKGLQLPNNTASNSSKRMKDVLTSLPVASSVDQNSQVVGLQPQVIKVMPHNPKSATESAARIFRSIQEEKKHL